MVLYELSLVAARIGLKKRIKRLEERKRAEEAEREEAKEEMRNLKKDLDAHFWGEEEGK